MFMSVLHASAGPFFFTFKGKRILFIPRGSLHWYKKARRQGSPVVDLTGNALLSARLVVGLSVRKKAVWNWKDVERIVVNTRKRQGRKPDSSIVTQNGVYRSEEHGEDVFERSIQVLIANLEGDGKARFTSDMRALAEVLRVRLKQEIVILEIQDKGIIVRKMLVVR